jgi:hypothetical protein
MDRHRAVFLFIWSIVFGLWGVHIIRGYLQEFPPGRVLGTICYEWIKDTNMRSDLIPGGLGDGNNVRKTVVMAMRIISSDKLVGSRISSLIHTAGENYFTVCGRWGMLFFSHVRLAIEKFARLFIPRVIRVFISDSFYLGFYNNEKILCSIAHF